MIRREEPIPALSAGLSHVVMTGLLLLVAFPAAQSVRVAKPAADAQVGHTSDKATTAEHSSGNSVSPSPPDAVATAEPVKDEWAPAEVTRAREQCMHLLSSVAADFEILEPVKKGSCGLPAPVRLKSVGSDPVVFDPPVHVNCEMVAALGNWVKTTLQPKATDRLKSRVVRIVGASGYSCRNIYNLPNARLSQHALANAIDIGGFGLANGRTVRVLRGWGPTERDIKAVAKAKAEAEAKAKAAAAKGGTAQKTSKAKPAAKDKADDAVAETAGAPVTKASLSISTAKPAPEKDAAGSKDAPDDNKPEQPAKPTKEALFLRAIHQGACREFGTVLGPEANDPHRNHFHLDLIPRRGRSYCE